MLEVSVYTHSLIFYCYSFLVEAVKEKCSHQMLFFFQVLNAQKAGYKAAIVHNVDSEDLISMGSNDCKITSNAPPITPHIHHLMTNI